MGAVVSGSIDQPQISAAPGLVVGALTPPNGVRLTRWGVEGHEPGAVHAGHPGRLVVPGVHAVHADDAGRGVDQPAAVGEPVRRVRAEGRLGLVEQRAHGDERPGQRRGPPGVGGGGQHRDLVVGQEPASSRDDVELEPGQRTDVQGRGVGHGRGPARGGAELQRVGVELQVGAGQVAGRRARLGAAVEVGHAPVDQDRLAELGDVGAPVGEQGLGVEQGERRLDGVVQHVDPELGPAPLAARGHPHVGGHDGQDPGAGVIGPVVGPVPVGGVRLRDGRGPVVPDLAEQVGEAGVVVLDHHRVVDQARRGERAAVGAAADVGVAEEPEGPTTVDGDGLGPVSATPGRAAHVEGGLQPGRGGGAGRAVVLGDGSTPGVLAGVGRRRGRPGSGSGRRPSPGASARRCGCRWLGAAPAAGRVSARPSSPGRRGGAGGWSPGRSGPGRCRARRPTRIIASQIQPRVRITSPPSSACSPGTAGGGSRTGDGLHRGIGAAAECWPSS